MEGYFLCFGSWRPALRLLSCSFFSFLLLWRLEAGSAVAQLRDTLWSVD